MVGKSQLEGCGKWFYIQVESGDKQCPPGSILEHMVRCWNRFLREVMNAPSLGAFKAELDEAFKVPSNLRHSMIL